MFRLSALLGKGLYFAGDVCTIEERPEGVPGIPLDPTGSKHKALCTRPAWYWITMPGAGAWLTLGLLRHVAHLIWLKHNYKSVSEPQPTARLPPAAHREPSRSRLL